MNVLQQVPRNALVWIIISLFALVAPHVARLPIWVLAVYVIAVIWRLQVHRGRWSFPGRWVKVAMTVSGFVGIYASYGTLVGLEPTVALLLTAFALKFIELSQRKDAYVLLFLGYFICITEFLFSQDLLITLYSVLTVVLVTSALVALHQPGLNRFNRGTARLAGIMLLQAVPLMVVLFFVFPRFGPLWTVPLKNHTAKTGMSDFMKPGDVASLSQSADVAFRVKFEGAIPEKSALYWRGLVFSRLEQNVWSGLGYYDVPLSEQRVDEVVTSGKPLSYSIIMESTQQTWLYGLNYARARSAGVLHSSDYRLMSPAPLETEYMYKVNSWLNAPIEMELSDWRRKTETTLPPQGNDRTRQMALDLRAAAGSDEAYIQAVLNKFNQEDYVYTLRPGKLSGQNTIDKFLFETQRGFCEHYASAFVFMMRAADVPARVVAGYQGGEINPLNKTVIVHQFDAHAWAEVWLENKGWVRVDPTAAVSPLRIEMGLEEAMASEGSFLSAAPLSPLRYRSIPLLNQLRLRYDALTYRWQSWVVGFDSEQQFDLLHSMFGEISTRVFATLLLGSWALVLVPVAISLFFKRATHPVSPLDKYYRIFCDRMAGLGLVRSPGETPGQFAHRAIEALPGFKEELLQITGLYDDLAYAGVKDKAELTQFTRAVNKFRPDRRRGLVEEDITI
ncbi:Protein-glutamine gamma-glutamyltransferase [Halioglobus japonicus]|nr:Protein-glutamine gamma-glutamyltransferase [Halioglobus japonicus]